MRSSVLRVTRMPAAGADAIHPMLADVTREDDCARTVAAALERFGRLDILVNNAGRGMRYVSEDFSDAADALLGDARRDVAAGHRNQRRRPVSDGARCGAVDA